MPLAHQTGECFLVVDVPQHDVVLAVPTTHAQAFMNTCRLYDPFSSCVTALLLCAHVKFMQVQSVKAFRLRDLEMADITRVSQLKLTEYLRFHGYLLIPLRYTQHIVGNTEVFDFKKENGSVQLTLELIKQLSTALEIVGKYDTSYITTILSPPPPRYIAPQHRPDDSTWRTMKPLNLNLKTSAEIKTIAEVAPQTPPTPAVLAIIKPELNPAKKTSAEVAPPTPPTPAVLAIIKRCRNR
jgi:hypothetical protein